MSRYIDADSLIRSLYIQSDDDGFICCGADDLETLINAQPTADVVERKRGKWIKCSDTAFYWMCSECGAYLFWRKEEYLLREEDEANFCPSCGADMRKEVRR